MMNKKLRAKLNKSAALLLRIHGISLDLESNSVSQILFVANGGLICGWTYESLQHNFGLYGDIDLIGLYAHVPYSFVKFKDVNDAARSLLDINASFTKGSTTTSGLLCCAFSNTMPLERPDVQQTPGLHILEGFVSDAEAEALFSFVASQHDGHCSSDRDVSINNSLKNRKVFHFGYRFVYGSNSIDHENRPDPMPSICDPILSRLMETGLVQNRPNQLTINIYTPGQGIPYHTDTHSAFEDSIVSLSLNGAVVMDFRHPANGKHHAVFLPPKSLTIMADEFRYVWQHGIVPRLYDTHPSTKRVFKRTLRVSFTFRCVRTKPCKCIYPGHCDRVKPSNDSSLRFLPSSNEDAASLESECVHKVYDEIAHHFSSTRYSQWPGVRGFLDSLSSLSFVLDVGCGNGKYLAQTDKDLVKIGCDRSIKLMQICADKGFSVLCCDGICLPLIASRFDAVISIAVIHHLSTDERRLKALQQIMNVLRVGGKALIYVWAFEQKRNNDKSTYLKETFYSENNLEADRSDAVQNDRQNLSVDLSDDLCDEAVTLNEKPLVIHKNRTQFLAKDLLVPWETSQANGQNDSHSDICVDKEKSKTFLRFYHVFKEGELESLCKGLQNCHIVKTYYEQGNWCIVLEKV